MKGKTLRMAEVFDIVRAVKTWANEGRLLEKMKEAA